ncbi:MAG: ribonucleoside-triphosphate reductase [Candidatus Pacebacteria bacterium]|nr:ribonucleoside-triphosphate reductase [Candidatus Paceibacterota bacterium]
MTKKTSAKKVASKRPSSKKSKTNKDKGAQYRKFIRQVKKRNGTLVPFSFDKLIKATHKAMMATGEGSLEEATMVAHQVAGDLMRIARKHKDFTPTVEGIQDEVEKQLILSDYVTTAKAFILYRAERAKEREIQVEVPEHVKKLVLESEKYFKDNKFGEFVFMRSYAKWIPQEGRRETWIETIDRYMAFMKENVGNKYTEKEYTELREGILNQEAMPSMRLLQFAGDPARRCHAPGYNCSFLAPTQISDFAEAMYLSMSGCGVGFSTESYSAQELPIIKKQDGTIRKIHTVADSKEGWCDALTLGLRTWWSGKDIKFDYSKLRPAGARLKTMGGKSSGPDPLRNLMQFVKGSILARQGKRLTNIDVHDIMCKIAEVVVAGGVRRSAMISLSDLDDEQMRDAKSGQFYVQHPQRAMANNSAVYEEKPTAQEFLNEWTALIASGSGERGIFNRSSLYKTMPKRRVEYMQKKFGGNGNGYVGPLGTNPCGEIILQPKQFCNLTEVVARSNDTEASLLRKVRLAAMLGTYQASLSNFNYISKEWKKNIEEERLLGVSITGVWDSKVARNPKVLQKLRAEVNKINKQYAKKLGINSATATTSVKPSGTLSSVVNSSSGMHARHAPYYIRRIRITATDSLFKMLKAQGVPAHPEVGQTVASAHTWVLEFPVKAPPRSTFSADLSAIDQLEHWKNVKLNYTEHNPSVTVSIGDDEWVGAADWVYSNWDIVGGLSFLPRNDHVYQLAPFEEITKEEFERREKEVARIDFSKLPLYELKDETDVKKELACAGGVCEIEI